MRLIDLQPRWTGYGQGDDVIITGLTFQCPHCKVVRLGIPFKEYIDPQHWLEKGVIIPHQPMEWTRTGDTFDTITIRPSINTEFAGHWHGFITQGEVI